MQYSTSYAEPGLKKPEPLLSAVLSSKLDPCPDHKLRSAQTVHPPLKSPQTLAAAKFLSNSTVQLQGLRPDAGLQKNTIFSSLIVGLAGPRIRATCVKHSAVALTAQLYPVRLHNRELYKKDLRKDKYLTNVIPGDIHGFGLSPRGGS
jgi:hypothetical protein